MEVIETVLWCRSIIELNIHVRVQENKTGKLVELSSCPVSASGDSGQLWEKGKRRAKDRTGK